MSSVHRSWVEAIRIHRTVSRSVSKPPLAALRQLSPRFWLTATLGSLIAVSAAALWWEQQLPSRLTKALDRGDYEACIRAGEQLAALRWLGEGAPDEQALCRQRQAEQLWREGDTTGALALQQKLVMSERGT